MLSKLQFDLDEQNIPIIGFRRSSVFDDVRDKMANRFFENVDGRFPLLSLKYSTSSPRHNTINEEKYSHGEITPVSENEVLGILSGELSFDSEIKFNGEESEEIILAIEESEDPRTKVFDYVRDKLKITDFKELLKLSQLIGYKMGTTPFCNYGYESGIPIDISIDGHLIVKCYPAKPISEE